MGLEAARLGFASPMTQFNTLCFTYVLSLMTEERAAAGQPQPGALAGAEVAVGAPSHMQVAENTLRPMGQVERSFLLFP